MKFLVDECTGPGVANWLKANGHYVISIFSDYRGLDDVSIINLAYKEECIIIIMDKDFGELIFKDKKKHKGVILLKLDDSSVKNKIIVIKKLFDTHITDLQDNFIVVHEDKVRITRLK